MTAKTLTTAIRKYFEEVDEQAFPRALKPAATAVLAGSAGWGIEEGADAQADWDLHILLDELNYQKYLESFGPHHVLDDHHHRPSVFGQIRSINWLQERLDGQLPGSWPLYLWIYTRCRFIQDPLHIQEIIKRYGRKFRNELNNLRRDHFVKFSVRRLDTSSCARRGLITGAGINRGEMVQLALQTFSLIRGEPYPYSKWLAKHVEQLAANGPDFVQLCNKCLLATDLETINKCAQNLRDRLEEEMVKQMGEARWIKFWWEFNAN